MLSPAGRPQPLGSVAAPQSITLGLKLGRQQPSLGTHSTEVTARGSAASFLLLTPVTQGMLRSPSYSLQAITKLCKAPEHAEPDSCANIDSGRSQEPGKQLPALFVGADGVYPGTNWTHRLAAALAGARQLIISPSQCHGAREKHPKVQLRGCKPSTAVAEGQRVGEELGAGWLPSLSLRLMSFALFLTPVSRS